MVSLVDHILVEVADQRDADLFFLRPSFLSKRAVNADADDVGVQITVAAETGGDVAKLLGADAGECEWEE